MQSGLPLTALALAAAAVLPAPGFAQDPPPITVEHYRLDNGLQVILAPDHRAQVVAVDMWYNVGSRNEERGRTGFAHLFEHMMFQGSANVAKAQHMQLVERAGGDVNGSTAEDRTNYYQVLPSNRLNLGLWLEADRMRSLAVTDENFENQREAVKEERRLRVDNQPYTGVIFEGMYALADSSTCFPYAHSVIGSMEDLNAAKTADVQAFFDLYYAPNNATLVVTGDFDPAEARQLIGTYFGEIPRGLDPPAVECRQTFSPGQIRRTWPDPNANLPGVLVGFRIPEQAHEDFPALQVLSTILGQGESSRINRAVVREQQLAQFGVTISNPASPRRGPGVLFTLAIANQGVAVEDLERAILAEFERIGRDGIDPEELTKARNAARTQLINGRQDALTRAEAIHGAAMFYGDPDAVNTSWRRVQNVTMDDIRRVASRYLVADNSLILLITAEVAR